MCRAGGYAEGIKRRCLEQFNVFGKAHLRHVIAVTYHNEERPHQGVGNTRLRRFGEKEPPTAAAEGAIVCRQRLGGLLKRYCRQAA